jgi:hypothetical protein
MNLIVIEKTYTNIKAEAKQVDLCYSDFIKNMIFHWRNNWAPRMLPGFTEEKKKTINISANDDEVFCIREIQIKYFEKFKKRLTYWQMIEAAWVWHCYEKEKTA